MFGDWVDKIREQGDYEIDDVYQLIDNIKKLSPPDGNEAKKNLKDVIVALIVLANKSLNVEFRHKVIGVCVKSC